MKLYGYSIDASEAVRIGAALSRLSEAGKRKAWDRARATIRRRLRAETIRQIVRDTDLRPKDVRPKIRDRNDGSAYAIDVRSRWLPLHELGAVRKYGKRRPRDAQGRFAAGSNGGGVTVRGWGRHRGAFVAKMKSGKVGIFRRTGEGRAIRELWGPNPAWSVLQNAHEHMRNMHEIVNREFLPELERQVAYLLAQAGG